jgi:hypothetical protein
VIALEVYTMAKLETMTVAQLREALSKFSDDALVCIRVPSRDYWSTELAGEIQNIQKEETEFSAYHNAHKIVDAEESTEGTQTVVVLG